MCAAESFETPATSLLVKPLLDVTVVPNEEVCAFLKDCFLEMWPAQEMLAAIPHTYVLIAKNTETVLPKNGQEHESPINLHTFQLIGFAVVETETTHIKYIKRIAVHRNFRRFGVGTSFLKLLRSHFEEIERVPVLLLPEHLTGSMASEMFWLRHFVTTGATTADFETGELLVQSPVLNIARLNSKYGCLDLPFLADMMARELAVVLRRSVLAVQGIPTEDTLQAACKGSLFRFPWLETRRESGSDSESEKHVRFEE
jgi:hypothetical protein